jgi:hypothetical protein
MAEGEFIWIYLIFFAIPLARIIPRLIRKWQNKDKSSTQKQFNQNLQKWEQKSSGRRDSFEKIKSFVTTESFEKPKSSDIPESFEKPKSSDIPESFEKPKSSDIPESFEKPIVKDMKVLGEINKGVKDFNQIQKNVNISNKELEEILKNFEDEGLMRVIKKEGVIGGKIELHPTEKGFRKFNK